MAIDSGTLRAGRDTPRWVALLAPGLVGVAGLLLLAGCIVDCGSFEEIRAGTSTPNSVVLDADHPIAEQLVTVHVNAAALPTSGTTDAVFIIRADARPQPAASAVAASGAASSGAAASVAAPSPSPSAGPAIVPEVTIVRDDTNEVVPMTIPPTGPTGYPLQSVVAAIALDCPLGESCDRTYRVRLAVPGLGVGQSVTPSWSVLVEIRYSGIDTYCGAPERGSASVDTADPVLIPVAEAAFASTGVQAEASAPLVARHLTVTSQDAAPTAASLRLSIVQADREGQEMPWRPWVRVVADGSTTPSASSLVGPQPYGAVAGAGATLDVPVLVDCVAGEACTRGYWLIFQDVVSAPQPASVPDTPPSTLGQLSWSIGATATYGSTGPPAPALSVTVDDLASGLAGDEPIDAAADEVVLKTNKVPTAIDATFTLPARPEPTNGLDPFAASVVVVHVRGRGVSLITRLEGDGAETMSGYFNGDGATNLIAHPFDRCPPSGPCTVTLRLVGTFNVEKYGGQATSANLSWSVSVIGAPAGTTVSFTSPYEMPAP